MSQFRGYFLSHSKFCLHVDEILTTIPKANHDPDVTLWVISDVCLVLYTLELSLG